MTICIQSAPTSMSGHTHLALPHQLLVAPAQVLHLRLYEVGGPLWFEHLQQVRPHAVARLMGHTLHRSEAELPACCSMLGRGQYQNADEVEKEGSCSLMGPSYDFFRQVSLSIVQNLEES